MEGHRQYLAAIVLLAQGGVIEQLSEAPIRYRLRVGQESVPLNGGIVRQLLVNRRIRETCRVNGRLLYVAT